MAGARLVVSGDTGLAHLAFAYARPSVTLYGPVSPRLWGPPADRRHRVIWHGTGVRPGDPHGRSPDRRLLLIGPREVLDAAAADVAVR
ncbi:glycosyltransferase family 9 protein [Actinocorallia sp. B10E7]|uniref:glycosyltransferase family 9 protein n=1 Tax=Actinocorallia sp. B10E7 TaxID=3153558 RepID=UPI00325CF71E